MKKITALILVLALTFTAAGCKKTETAETSAPETVETAAKTGGGSLTLLPASGSTAPPEETEGTEAADNSSVDLDLTSLSSTVVYSEVYNMMTAPDDYIGMTVRMKGQFTIFQGFDENGEVIPDQIYFACVIADATACCQQGLEFVLAEDRAYPEDYPELGAEITVVGEFQTYYEGDYLYCHLVDAKMDV